MAADQLSCPGVFIIFGRTLRVRQILEDIETEIGLIAGWRGEAGRIRQEEEDQLVDIKEEFSPAQVATVQIPGIKDWALIVVL